MLLGFLFNENRIAFDTSFKDQLVAQRHFTNMSGRGNILTHVGGDGVTEVVDQREEPRSIGCLINRLVKTVIEFNPSIRVDCPVHFLEDNLKRLDSLIIHLGDSQTRCHTFKNAAQYEDFFEFVCGKFGNNRAAMGDYFDQTFGGEGT